MMQWKPFLLLAAHPIVHVNASLNAAATVLLVVGFYFIKRRRVEAHKRTMMAAFVVSTVFLACYVYYHYQVGSVKFTHSGSVRYAYYLILISHVLLAFTVPFLAIAQIYLGYRAIGCCGDRPLFSQEGDAASKNAIRDKGTLPLAAAEGDGPLFAADVEPIIIVVERKKGTVPASYLDKHIRLAHWTFPIWLYVSVTGVAVYVMLYHLWPPAGL